MARSGCAVLKLDRSEKFLSPVGKNPRLIQEGRPEDSCKDDQKTPGLHSAFWQGTTRRLQDSGFHSAFWARTPKNAREDERTTRGLLDSAFHSALSSADAQWKVRATTINSGALRIQLSFAFRTFTRSHRKPLSKIDFRRTRLPVLQNTHKLTSAKSDFRY